MALVRKEFWTLLSRGLLTDDQGVLRELFVETFWACGSAV